MLMLVLLVLIPSAIQSQQMRCGWDWVSNPDQQGDACSSNLINVYPNVDIKHLKFQRKVNEQFNELRSCMEEIIEINNAEEDEDELFTIARLYQELSNVGDEVSIDRLADIWYIHFHSFIMRNTKITEDVIDPAFTNGVIFMFRQNIHH